MATHDQTLNPSAIILSQPKDIIYKIFFRLRVKTLLPLKSVCKPWLSLISSPEFIKTHLSNHGLVIVNRNDMHDLRTCSVYSLLHEPFTGSLQNDLHFKSVVAIVMSWFLYKIGIRFLVVNCTCGTSPKLDWKTKAFLV